LGEGRNAPLMLERIQDASPTAPLAAPAHSLRLARLSKRFGAATAVDVVSLEVPRGEFLTLLGPSGSGKTTLLMMIAGFTEPSSGEIFVDGRAITRLAPERRNFGMVFQGYALFPHMTVAANVAYPLKMRGLGRAAIAEQVAAALAMVRLEGLDERLPHQLSGGQQQRVAIARALVYRPDILLLDEPLGALDRKLRAEVQMELKALHAELGTTFVYVTHDQDEALSMSDRVAILNGGRLVQEGRPRELYERPRTQFVAGFLGSSNFLAAERRDGELVCGGQRIAHAGPVAEPRALFALRPERVHLSVEEPTDAANRVPGRISAIAYLGATQQVVVQTERLGAIIATGITSSMHDRLAPGASVWLSWAADATTLLDDET
jgi:putative spermidine/putrescine transport system ATP-binding protein